jgi:8-oxo-dGTP pyrophosphatase MutT (NUDIX family)
MDKQAFRYRSAGGVVINRQGQVLLIERTIEGRHEVRLPKGHIEPGEMADAAALREVCEETGYCDLEILADLGWQTVAFEHPRGYPVIRDERYFFLALASDQQRAPQYSSDREALFRNRWVTDFEEAENWLTFESEKDAVRRAQFVELDNRIGRTLGAR